MKIKLITIISLLILFLALGCTDDPDENKDGQLGEKCKTEKVCDEGLVCDNNNICQDGQNICKNISCSNHGTCEVVNSKTQCNCEAGFHADGNFCRPDDLCAGISCSNQGTCAVVGNEPKCTCKNGYHVLNGVYCISDNNPCEGVTCSGHGACVNNSGVPSCNCEDTYTRNGLECLKEVPAECEGVTCSNHGTCEAIAGAAKCNCTAGYISGGDLTCIKNICNPNPCLEMEGTADDDCIALNATEFSCNCDSARFYVWDSINKNCKEETQETACEDTHASKDIDGNCKCTEGYAKDESHVITKEHDLDLLCAKISTDVCVPDPCAGELNKHCETSAISGRATCVCDSGYAENNDGECVAGVCDPNPCTEIPHKTVCTVSGGNYVCACEAGYKDENGECVASVDACAQNPCTHVNMVGTCVNVVVLGDSIPYCQCKPGFIGDCTTTGVNWCCNETEGDSCTSDVCVSVEHSTGQCIHIFEGACECESGYIYQVDETTGIAACVLDAK